MAKLARPAGVPSRFSSANTWRTMAVEDIARARPITAARMGGSPSSTLAPVSAAAQVATCSAPRPNTSRRISHSRSSDSSSPIMNSSSTTPRSAISWIAPGSPMVTRSSQGWVAGQRAEAERADDDAHQHEAKGRAELQAMKQRDDHPGGGQDDQRGLVAGEVERGVHAVGVEVFAGADTRPAGRADYGDAYFGGSCGFVIRWSRPGLPRYHGCCAARGRCRWGGRGDRRRAGKRTGRLR